MYRSAALFSPLVLALSAAGHDPVVHRAPAQTGRIAGTVEISASLTSRRPQFRIYENTRTASIAPRVPENELTAELRNVVLYLRADQGTELQARDDSAAIAVMSQIGERFDPHVLPVQLGTRVDFPNYDEIYHNVFSLSRARTFDLGRYPKGASKAVTFTKPGVVQVFCHIHADMSGIVMVLANPLFTVPDAKGAYALENVPPGEYTIVGWHERTKPVSHRVRVVAGRTTTVHFKLPLGTTPGS